MTLLLESALVLYILSFLAGLFTGSASGTAFGRFSKIALVAGLLLHSAALAVRVAATGHAPMASMFETLVFYSWTTVVLTAFVVLRYDERRVERITVPVAALALLFAVLNETPGGPLSLILRTHWFEAHVTLSFAAYAFFTLAFAGAVLFLLAGADEGSDTAVRYRDIAAKGVLWGFCLFSAAMFSGAVWAYLAWGTYWLWEPKTIWSFIVWFYYAGAMHAYYVKDWRGRGLGVATAFGFVVVLFTYLGVSLLMKSSHSF